MKILINKNSGQVLTVNKILRSDDKVMFTLYDNFILYQQGKFLLDSYLPINKNIVPTELLSWDAYLEYIAVNTILAEYINFVTLDDNQGWCRSTGSDGEPTTLRVMLPYDLVAKETNTDSPLDQLVKGMAQLSPWLTRGEKSGVQYLQFLLPEHKTILESYSYYGVVIDNKIIE